LGPLGTETTNRPIVPTPGDYYDGEIVEMIGKRYRGGIKEFQESASYKRRNLACSVYRANVLCLLNIKFTSCEFTIIISCTSELFL
jgi:hypothetical protein